MCSRHVPSLSIHYHLALYSRRVCYCYALLLNSESIISDLQVELTHSEGCMAEAMVCSKDQPVSLKKLEEDFEKDIRQWTFAGFQLVDMYKLISVRLAPLYLGQTGRRKVKIYASSAVLYLVRVRLYFFHENLHVVDCDRSPPITGRLKELEAWHPERLS